MCASLNKVMVIGNLTRDPELRRISTGTAVTTLRLAISESFTRRDGGREERTLFLDVDVWDRQAETCQQYLSKGSPVFIEGRIQMDEWEDKASGQKRSRMKIRADRVQFLSGRRDGGGQGGGSYTPRAQATPPTSSPSQSTYQDPLASGGDNGEEIPF